MEMQRANRSGTFSSSENFPARRTEVRAVGWVGLFFAKGGVGQAADPPGPAWEGWVQS